MCLLLLECPCSWTFSRNWTREYMLAIHIYQLIDQSIKNYDFTLISPIPTYYHRVHSSFLSFQILTPSLTVRNLASITFKNIYFFASYPCRYLTSCHCWIYSLLLHRHPLCPIQALKQHMWPPPALPPHIHAHTLTQMPFSSFSCSSHPTSGHCQCCWPAWMLSSLWAPTPCPGSSHPTHAHTGTIYPPFSGCMPSSPHWSSESISLLRHTPHFAVALMACIQLPMPSPSSPHMSSNATLGYLLPLGCLSCSVHIMDFGLNCLGREGIWREKTEGKENKGGEEEENHCSHYYFFKKGFVCTPGSVDVQCKKQTTPGVLSVGICLRWLDAYMFTGGRRGRFQAELRFLKKIQDWDCCWNHASWSSELQLIPQQLLDT